MSDILIVDDERDIRELLSDILKDEGFQTRVAGNSKEAIDAIEHQQPAMLVLDIWLKDSEMDGIEILKFVKKNTPEVPVVIISGHGNIEIAVAAIKQGAYDFIEKPFNIDQLMVVIHRAMETANLRRENTELRTQDVTQTPLIGGSTVFKSLKSALEKVAKSNGRVLFTGPSGVGKKTAARFVHENSSRAGNPFVGVDCDTLTDAEFETVLFGSEHHGDITTGLFDDAAGGVLYFNNISELPIAAQTKLTRVLVENQFTRVGGKNPIKIDIRIFSATRNNLQKAVETGQFREDLFHRLNVVPIEIPGLEMRRDDIPVLADYFIQDLNQTQGLSVRALSSDASAMLQSSPWPGNLRQLRNAMERILILGPTDGDIQQDEIPVDITVSEISDDRVILSGSIATLSLREARELFEREYLLTQISRFGGNISRTASFVGMERSALHRKLKSLGVVTSNRSASRNND